MKLKIIGIGGIGQWLLLPLCLFFRQQEEPTVVWLIDGDDYEERNRERQHFRKVGNKAQIKVDELAPQFPEISFLPVPFFVTVGNVTEIIEEGDWVILAVDNHKTRKIVSDHCQGLEDVVLISGGNELTDGDVSIYIRRDEEDLTLPLTTFHKEIEFPSDEGPSEEGCAVLAEAEPQLIFTNFLIAAGILAAFYRVWQAFALAESIGDWREAFAEIPDEIYYDLLAFLSRPVKRRE